MMGYEAITNFVPTKRHGPYPTIDPLKADLSGKVVLIAGASKGAGKATAIAMAQAGVAGLVLLARSDLSTVKAECLAAKRAGQTLEVLTLPVDIANNEQVVAAVKKAEEAFGRLDVVINNAAYVSAYTFVADSDPEDWWRTWDVNLKGTYHVIRATIPLLIKSNGDKTIINIVSLAAVDIIPTLGSYAMTKLALMRFAEYLNVEYGDKGLLAYSVHPGSMETELTSTAPDDYKIYLVDKPELPAQTLVWLIKERRDWLAGRFIDATWDMEELEKKEEVVKGNKLKVRLAI